MESFARAYYELLFKVRFMEARGDAFQDFFAEVMEKRHVGDFHRVTTWGARGDLKNDGYLSSARQVFQCYAPHEPDASRTTAKMERDFEGAVEHWREYMDSWVFVSDDRRGIPAPIEQKLVDLADRYEDIHVEMWGFEELRQRVFELTDVDVAALLGPAPSRIDVADPRYTELEPILAGIAARLVPPLQQIEPVSIEKINANGLSDGTRTLVAAGAQGESRVGEFFRDHYDPERGDEVAAAFAAEYQRLRETDMPPDDIFTALRIYAGGPLILSPQREAAVLALLAYLFHRCDIFENAVIP
jgi:hypothetical protein